MCMFVAVLGIGQAVLRYLIAGGGNRSVSLDGVEMERRVAVSVDVRSEMMVVRSRR
jgi:hypothetical protein